MQAGLDFDMPQCSILIPAVLSLLFMLYITWLCDCLAFTFGIPFIWWWYQTTDSADSPMPIYDCYSCYLHLILVVCDLGWLSVNYFPKAEFLVLSTYESFCDIESDCLSLLFLYLHTCTHMCSHACMLTYLLIDSVTNSSTLSFTHAFTHCYHNNTFYSFI